MLSLQGYVLAWVSLKEMRVTESLSHFLFWHPVSPKQLLNSLVSLNQTWEGSHGLREIKFLHVSEIKGSRVDKRHQS